MEGIKKKSRRKRTKRKRTVVDSAARNAALLSDGCNPEFVKGAEFDGVFEIPIIINCTPCQGHFELV